MRRKIIICATALLVLLLIADWRAGSILIAPEKKTIGPLPLDLNGQDVDLSGGQLNTLRGWFLPGRRGQGTVVLMHGVRGSRLDMLGRARFLSHAGYSVLLFDFQAHGESRGDRITFGYRESKDAQAAVNYAHYKAPLEKVGVIGVSMGGIAALLASPRLDVDAMVIEMASPSMRQAISNRLAARLGGWARILSPLLYLQVEPRLGFSVDDIRPIDRIGQIPEPKLLIAGAEDKLTTLEESRELFGAANEPKELWVVEGAGHVDVHNLLKDEYEEKVLLLFDQTLKK